MPCVCKICGWSADLPEDYKQWPDKTDNAGVYPITRAGVPAGEMLGFICARCLRAANSMRVHIKATLARIKVGPTALRRFVNGQRNVRMDDASAKVALIKTFLSAERGRSKPQIEIWHNAGWIFTVKKGEPLEIIALDHVKWRSPLQKGYSNGKKVRAGDANRRSRQTSPRARQLKRSQQVAEMDGVRRLVEERKKREESQPPAHDSPHEVFGCPSDEPCVHKSFETPYERNGR